MRRLRFASCSPIALAGGVVLATALAGCPPPSCMEAGYARASRGEATYTLSRAKDADRGAAETTLRSSVTMRRFHPFRRGKCAYEEDPNFEVELGPSCRLEANVTSRLYDNAKEGDGTLDFVEAGAELIVGQRCTLPLDGENRVTGSVDSGAVTLVEDTVVVSLFLDVDKWNDDTTPGRSLQYGFEGTWSD